MSVHISCDQTEIMMMVLRGSKWAHLNVTYDKIRRIQFDTCKAMRWLVVPSPSEKITIECSASSEPLVFLKSKEKQYWDQYKVELSAFAKRNRITFADNT